MDKFLELLVALPIAATSLWLIYFFIRPIFQHFGVLKLPKQSGFKFRRNQRYIRKADDLMNEGKFFEAMKELRKSLILDVLKNEDAIFKTREHHQNLLSRCLVIGEQLNCKLENLPKVEHLVTQRSELLLLLLKTETAYRNFLSKRKDAPEWSKKDYQMKVLQVKQELSTNKTDLSRELDSLLKNLKISNKESNVTFH